MKQKMLMIIAAAAITISCFAVQPTMAYFTASSSAEGMIELKLGDGKLDNIDEDVEAMVKKISISNTGDYDIFVRAKAIFPDSCTVTMETSEGWTAGQDGYYYYSDVVAPGDSTEKLNLKIENEGAGDFNVVIVQEACKVIYEEDGTAKADWTSAIKNTINNTINNTVR